MTGTAADQPLVLVGVGTIVLLVLVIIGVALPAVWSRKPNRRQDAFAVLRLLIEGPTKAKNRVSRRDDKPESARGRRAPARDQHIPDPHGGIGPQQQPPVREARDE